jgi:hypothetical protein
LSFPTKKVYSVKNPDFCDHFPPASTVDIKSIEAEVSFCSTLLRSLRKTSDSDSVLDFYSSFLCAYKRGTALRVCNALISPQDAETIIRLKDLEAVLLPHFSKMIEGILRKNSRKFGLDPAELQSEAYSSFVLAMLNYNGEASFCTYLNSVVSNNLSRCGSEGGLVKVPERTRRLSIRVLDAMHKDHKSFDSAVDSIGLSARESKRVAFAMQKVYTTTELDVHDSDIATARECKPKGWFDSVATKAKLGVLEKAALDAFLSSPSGKMWLSKGCRGMLNPKTGKPYSRAAISSAWKQARRKLAVVLEDAA